MGTEGVLNAQDAAQRRVLLQVLMLNVGLAITLLIGGLAADSSGLIANALDNTSDAAAYLVSLFAVTRSQRWKVGAAAVTGVMLIVLAIGVSGDALRRFITGSEPLGPLMILLALVAGAINVWCIRLLRVQSKEDVNLRAAWTMSVNDFISNFGIVVAGVLVLWLGRNWPDLAVAAAISTIAAYGGVKTLRDAVRSRGEAGNHSEHSHD